MRLWTFGRVIDCYNHPRRNVTDAARERKRRWQQANYDHVKMHARRLLRSAIERGDIIKPKKCDECKCHAVRQDGVSAIQGHHDDYANPLAVKWFCPLCHRKYHAAIAGEGKHEQKS